MDGCERSVASVYLRVIMTVNELKMMRNKAFSNHPWMLTNVGRAVARIRGEFGEETWELVTKTLEQARATKDVALWQSVIDDLIIKLNQPKKEQVEIIRDGVTCWKCGLIFSRSILKAGVLTLWCNKCRELKGEE